MGRSWALGAAIAAVAGASAAIAQAYHPFEAGRLKGPRSGSPNLLLVLGGPHLSGMPAAFRPQQLEPVLDKLDAWHPQAIAVEAVSGAQCDVMRHYPDRYRETVEAYCWDPTPAAHATGLDVPSATAAWGHDGDGLDTGLVARLERLRTAHDESLLIAAALAARLGLERVYAMDDHTADAPVADEKGYDAAIAKAWDNPATARRKAMDAALEAKLGEPGAMLGMYRAYNAADQARLIFDSDFGAALEEPSTARFGRNYLGGWETRNLRMASNIRDMFAERPGIRALIVVGASHTPYLESYLNQMHDMIVVDAETVLQ
jgi:hypothetical protein